MTPIGGFQPAEEGRFEAAIAGHRERNLQLIDMLAGKDVDPREMRLIELHFWAASQQDAVLLANALYERNFLISVLAPCENDSLGRWNIEAEARQTIQLTVSDDFTEEMVRLAARHSAVYDGWGTSIETDRKGQDDDEDLME